jgi:hypothetical protein
MDEQLATGNRKPFRGETNFTHLSWNYDLWNPEIWVRFRFTGKAHPCMADIIFLRFSGILNQEAQAVDKEGRIHVLNRENTTGVEQWSVNLTISCLLDQFSI